MDGDEQGNEGSSPGGDFGEMPDPAAVAATLAGLESSADEAGQEQIGASPGAAEDAGATGQASKEEQPESDSDQTPTGQPGEGQVEEDLPEGVPEAAKKWLARQTQKSQQIADDRRALEAERAEFEVKKSALGADDVRQMVREELRQAAGKRPAGDEDDPFDLGDEDRGDSREPAGIEDLLKHPRLRGVLEYVQRAEAAEARRQRGEQERQQMAAYSEQLTETAESFGIHDPSGVLKPGAFLEMFHYAQTQESGNEALSIEQAALLMVEKHPTVRKKSGAPQGTPAVKKPAPKVLKVGGSPPPPKGTLSEIGSDEETAEVKALLEGIE